MFYRPFLAVVSSGLIAFETLAVSLPLISVDSDLVNPSVRLPSRGGTTDVQTETVPHKFCGIFGMSSVGITEAFSVIQLVAAMVALGHRKTDTDDDEVASDPESLA